MGKRGVGVRAGRTTVTVTTTGHGREADVRVSVRRRRWTTPRRLSGGSLKGWQGPPPTTAPAPLLPAPHASPWALLSSRAAVESDNVRVRVAHVVGQGKGGVAGAAGPATSARRHRSPRTRQPCAPLSAAAPARLSHAPATASSSSNNSSNRFSETGTVALVAMSTAVEVGPGSVESAAPAPCLLKTAARPSADPLPTTTTTRARPSTRLLNAPPRHVARLPPSPTLWCLPRARDPTLPHPATLKGRGQGTGSSESGWCSSRCRLCPTPSFHLPDVEVAVVVGRPRRGTGIGSASPSSKGGVGERGRWM